MVQEKPHMCEREPSASQEPTEVLLPPATIKVTSTLHWFLALTETTVQNSLLIVNLLVTGNDNDIGVAISVNSRQHLSVYHTDSQGVREDFGFYRHVPR